jgi:hypothetical protein
MENIKNKKRYLYPVLIGSGSYRSVAGAQSRSHNTERDFTQKKYWRQLIIILVGVQLMEVSP